MMVFFIVGLCLLGVIFLAVTVLFILFRGEIATLRTIKKVGETDLFTMEYKGDYGFDTFLKQGAATDADVIAFISKRLLKGIPLKVDIPHLGCSNFLAKTPDNEYISGRSFDNYYTPVLFLTTRPKGGYASVSVVGLRFIGYSEDYMPIKFFDRILAMAAPYASVEGLNEKGVSAAVLQLHMEPTNQDTGKVNITSTTAIRLILDKAANVDEALSLLRQYDMRSSAGGSYHYHITDANGNAALVEYIDGDMIIRDDKYVTNFVLEPGQWFNHGEGQERYEIIAEKFKETDGIMTERQSADLLKAVSEGRLPTQWSVTYNNTRKTARLYLRADFDKAYDFSI